MEIKILENEYWWGCASHFNSSQKFPFGEKDNFSFDLRVNTSNQSAPLMVSSKGRVLSSERPFAFEVKKGVIKITFGDVELSSGGNCLKDAYFKAMKKYCPFEKRTIQTVDKVLSKRALFFCKERENHRKKGQNMV